MSPPDASTPTISSALADFLIWERLALSDDEFTAACEVVDHLQACLNTYGGDDPAGSAPTTTTDDITVDFCDRAEPDRIIGTLRFFVDYYVIRNVVTSAFVLAATGRVVASLAEWLDDNGYAETELAKIVRRQGLAASDALPRADRIATLLTDQVATTPSEAFDPRIETVEGFLAITGVDDGKLWFDDVGPISVDAEVSRLAELGWVVSIVLAHVNGLWVVREVGNVYPRSDV